MRGRRRGGASVRRAMSFRVGAPLALHRLEGRHRDRLVTHFEDLDLLFSSWRAQAHGVTLARLDESARDGGDPAHVVPRGIHLVDADDAHGVLLPRLVRVDHGRAEEHLVRVLARGRIHHLGDLQALGEVADAPVDLAQPLLAVLVVGVLRAVAELRGPRHHARHLRALVVHEPLQLVAHAPPSRRREVVLRARGNRVRILAVEIVVGKALAVLARERLAHLNPSTNIRIPPRSISIAIAVRMSPMRRAIACMPRSPIQRCSRSPARSTTVAIAMVTTSAPAIMPSWRGSFEASSITVARAEGPEMSGMASGTMKGSPRGSSPKAPSGCANTIRIAIMKRITPPAIDNDVSERCMRTRISGPNSMNAASRRKAMPHSRT